MKQKRLGNTITVDVHGMTAEECKRGLERLLTTCPEDVKEIVIIHGYQGGTALRQMIFSRLRHRRIATKGGSLNPGETHLLLK